MPSPKSIVALVLVLAWLIGSSPVAHSQRARKGGPSASFRELHTWHDSFADAQAEACDRDTLILAYIPRLAWPGAGSDYDALEAQVLANGDFDALAKNYVLFEARRGASLSDLPVGALAVEHASQSVLFLDADGWALSRVEVRYRSQARRMPLRGQIEDLTREAAAMAKVRSRLQRAGDESKAPRKVRKTWLEWAAHSGQLVSLEEARPSLDGLKLREGSSARDAIEVAVILNAAQAKGGRSLVDLPDAACAGIAESVWPYFERNFLPQNELRQWSFLMGALHHAETLGDVNGYRGAMKMLVARGACGDVEANMKETLTRLENAGRSHP